MPREGGGRFEWRPDLTRKAPRKAEGIEGGETGINFGALHLALQKYLRAGTPEELARLLEEFPQRDEQGKLNYLFTSGWAVQAVTGVEREHHDIDVVDMKSESHRSLVKRMVGIDDVTPERYWADMTFKPAFLERTSTVVEAFPGKPDSRVEIVHPAILLVQKVSNAFGRSPRDKDWADARSLIGYLHKHPWEQPEWQQVIEVAIAALPKNQQATTRQRLFNNHETPRR